MNKSWMSKSRFSTAYDKRVEDFIMFVEKKLGKGNPFPCPCRRCGNLEILPQKTVGGHLYVHGIEQRYTKWIWHGEKVPTGASTSVPMNEHIDQDYEREPPDDAVDTIKLAQAAREEYIGNPEKFQKLLEDSEEPLYKGCSKFTKLSEILRLFNLKARSGWSDKSFSQLLRLIGEMLPTDDNVLPKNMYEVKKALSVYGMEYQKIHACPNDCVLYSKEYKNETKCPTCGESRYKVNKNTNEEGKGVPRKVLWYFPPIPRFKKLFQFEQTAKDLTWYADEREVDDKLRHPADSPAWKLVDDKWPAFGEESRNLRLALSADGVNPHGMLSSKYSCWPVMLVIYNLPPWLFMKRRFMVLTMLISGPRQPGNDIHKYLAPLIDDLNILWNLGVEVFDSYRQQSFTLRVVLLWTINDFPAYGNLSICTVKGYYVCPTCGEETDSCRLKHCKKNSTWPIESIFQENIHFAVKKSF